MALLNGEWLKREERTQRIELITDRLTKLRKLAEKQTLSPGYLDLMRQDIAELTRLKRVHRAEYDFLYFMTEYFSEDANPDNPDNLIPKGVNYDTTADFHKTLCNLLDEITTGKQRNNVAWCVGRGHAKTAYLSNGYLCHQTVFRHKRYIVLISETAGVAGDFIHWTRNQLKFNTKLRDDFGELLHPQKTKNEMDNSEEFITTSNIKVQAKGIGTQMRGLRHGASRPDLFLLDDLESKQNTGTPDLIEKNKNWFREEMLPALSREGICVYMGTIVCFDSLLDHVIKSRKDFISRKFPAVLSWPQREDLWEEWRRIYNEDEEDATERAQAFYKANETEMLRGTQVLWPSRFSYLDLMKIREEDGIKAFNQEYLGNPTDEERQIFKPDEMTFYTEEDLVGKNVDYVMAIDFAMGKTAGDYSVVAVLARNKDTGICYVYDMFNERVHPDKLLLKAVEMTLKYQPEVIACEAVAAQEWFSDRLGAELKRHGYPAQTRLKPIKQRTRKALRIESMLPDIQAGRVRFRQSHRLLLEQLEMYPMHKHDDCPDALQMAFEASKSGFGTIRTSTKRMR